MGDPFPYDLLEDPHRLAECGVWSAEVYRDLMACRAGRMTEQQFRDKYAATVAIMQLDMTGFTRAAMSRGSLFSFLRILDAQQVCVPVLESHGADRIRAFADDLTATFQEPARALQAALEIHRRMAAFNASDDLGEGRIECCIGLGYGEVYRIGPDQAMGDEMNRTSKLGEDTAEAGETLITDAFHAQVRHHPGCRFEPASDPEIAFPFYKVFAEG